MPVLESQPTGRSEEEILASLVAVHAIHHPDEPQERVVAAYELAAKAHAGQMRQTGDRYITHPMIVAEILAGYGMDATTLAAALLHDVVEDTGVTLAMVEDEFDTETAQLIDGVTKLDRIKFSSREQQQAATIRKMAIAMAKDIRVLVIKLADRLHNIRTITPLPEEKQRRVASETLEVYAPLAHRLGVQEIKHEMEETCFGVLYPKRKAELEELVRRRAPEREVQVEKVMSEVAAALSDAGVDAEITGRPKHLYSIYRKMVASGLAFEEIHDLIGIRIIVPEIRDCYAALGMIHTMWAPIHGRFKDYIATPKYNLYQSLHTTVVGPGGDGSLQRIKGTSKGLAVSTDGDGRLCYLDPRRGAERLVFEAALNVAVTGARPFAVVDNLNFGNPEKPEVMWQFREAVEGIAVACEALEIPVIGGNVSFYNETDGVDIYPSPVVGMLGFCDPMPEQTPRLSAAKPGMEVWEIGVAAQPDFAASAYARVLLDHLGGRPVDADLVQGPRVNALATQLAVRGVPVLHDISSGGLATAIAEVAIASGAGAELIDLDWRRWMTESPHRFVAVVPAGYDLAAGDVAANRVGTIGGDQIAFGRHGSIPLSLAATTWREAIPRRMH